MTIEDAPDLNFGEVAIVSGELNNLPATVSGPLEILDLRGTGEGWEIQASMSEFTDEAGDISLSGAGITFAPGNVTSPDGSVSIAPNPEEITLFANTTDGAFSADSGAGLGLWQTIWNSEGDVQLNIPAGTATAGNHTATITWTDVNDGVETPAE